MGWLNKVHRFRSSGRFRLYIYGCLILASCQWVGEPRQSSGEKDASTPATLSTPDISFLKRTIRLGSQTLVVEVADDEEKRQLGLMYRDYLEDGHGMLFIFDQEENLSFWMKNTYVPLSIGFFDRNRKLVDIQKMNPPHPSNNPYPPSYKSRHPAKYALEVPQGWFERSGISLGTTFEWK